MKNEYQFKPIPCPGFTLEVDVVKLYGYFEDDKVGDENGGGLWFELLPDGRLELTDYDGVIELPAKVKTALIASGFEVGEDY